MAANLQCFKAYDIRGKVPSSLNADIAYAVGKAFVQCLGSPNVVVGRDVRLSGQELENALTSGLEDAGAHVTTIGLCGTEEIYYAAFAKDFDGGIMITGSHNPGDENGIKMVRRGAVPVSGDSGLFKIREATAKVLAGGINKHVFPAHPLDEGYAPYRHSQIEFLLKFTGADKVVAHGLKIHADPGNGWCRFAVEGACAASALYLYLQ